jgi:hypothetical protein
MSNCNFRNYLTLFILSFIINSSYADSIHEREYEKKITKEFSINSDALIEFDTRHGDVNIKHGDSNSVYFEVTISTDADDEDDAERIFEGIDIDFTDSRSNVSVTTDIDLNSSRGGGWLSNIFGGWNNNINFQIDIEVIVPRSVELDIEHAFGNVFIPEMDNNVEVDIRHGDGRLATINADAIIGIRHGEINMKDAQNLEIECHHSEFYGGSAENVDIDISHSDLEIENAKKVEIDGAHSDFVFNRVHTLVTDISHSDFEIEELEFAEFDTNFGDVEIGLLGQEAAFDMQHGSIEIDEVSSNARKLEFDVQHTGVSLEIDQDFYLDYDGSHTEPRIKYDLDYSEIDDRSNSYRCKGTYGSSDPNLRIEVEIQHGSFRIDN